MAVVDSNKGVCLTAHQPVGIVIFSACSSVRPHRILALASFSARSSCVAEPRGRDLSEGWGVLKLCLMEMRIADGVRISMQLWIVTRLSLGEESPHT